MEVFSEVPGILLVFVTVECLKLLNISRLHGIVSMVVLSPADQI